MTTTEHDVVVTEPGIYTMPDEVYHADPVPAGSLSSTGARKILRSPAHFQQALKHREEKTEFDAGHYVHAKVLGVGMGTAVLDFPDRRTNAYKAAEKEAREAGLVPVLAKDVAHLDAMAEAVLADRRARALLERPGQAEASLFGTDPATGVWLRARVDYLPDPGPGRTLMGDLKTARSADPADFTRAVAEHGYDVQDALYRAVLELVRGDESPAFIFVVVEKEPPYLVSVNQLDEEYLDIGHRRARRAIERYAQCVASGEWPGYPADEITVLSPPRWYARAEDPFAY